MNRAISIKNLRAFTLPELLKIVLIIGIVAWLAMLNLKLYLAKDRGTEAHLQLNYIYRLEKNYFFIHSRYSSNLRDISSETASPITEGGNSNYVVEIIEATNTGFKAHAISITDFDRDGILNVWEIDQDKNIQEIIPD